MQRGGQRPSTPSFSQFGVKVTDGLGVALAELLDTRDEASVSALTSSAMRLADGRLPLVVEHERLDVGLGEVAVLLERRAIERGLSFLGCLLGGGFGVRRADQRASQRLDLVGIASLRAWPPSAAPSPSALRDLVVVHTASARAGRPRPRAPRRTPRPPRAAASAAALSSSSLACSSAK